MVAKKKNMEGGMFGLNPNYSKKNINDIAFKIIHGKKAENKISAFSWINSNYLRAEQRINAFFEKLKVELTKSPPINNKRENELFDYFQKIIKKYPEKIQEIIRNEIIGAENNFLDALKYFKAKKYNIKFKPPYDTLKDFKSITDPLEILKKELSEFIRTLTFDNLAEKLLELQKIYKKINLTHEKIVNKEDETLNKDFLDIFNKYRLLFPAFSTQILVLLKQNELNINNLTYFSFIIDNLISLYLKIFYSSNISKSKLNIDQYYNDMLKVQQKISDEFDNMPKINTNNFNKLKNEKNDYMLREKILALSNEIYNQALKSKGDKLEELKGKLQELINLYKQKFIKSNQNKQNQVFPINQNTLIHFDVLYKNLNNSLANNLSRLSLNPKNE